MIVPKAMRMGPASRHRWSRCCCRALLLALAWAATAGAATDMPRFPLADRGPLNGLLGMPDGWVRPGGPAAELGWQAANNAMGQQSGGEALLLDGETHTVTLRWQRQFGGRLSLGLALPWMAHGGGFLDGAIDDWHDALGLSDGIRPDLPGNDLRYEYARDGRPAFAVDDATSGLGDLRTAAALRLVSPGDGRLTVDVTADLKWPTGEARRLTGSGGTDLALGLRLALPPDAAAAGAGRFGWSAQAGLMWPGDADDPLPPPAGQVWYYDAALAWAVAAPLDLIVQAQGHSGAWQSGLKMLGQEALQLGVGALWRVGGRYSLRLGVFEDIRTDTTPDFALELALVVGPRDRRDSGLAARPLDAQ